MRLDYPRSALLPTAAGNRGTPRPSCAGKLPQLPPPQAAPSRRGRQRLPMTASTSSTRVAQDGTLTEIHGACIKPLMTWKCPQCHRSFRQVNQRHACGVGNPATLLKDRPPELVGLYRKLVATINGFGIVEVVTRNRYALFRTTRIFMDLTVMRDALRVVIHLGRRVSAPYFVKIGEGGKRVSHVALVRTDEDPGTIKRFHR